MSLQLECTFIKALASQQIKDLVKQDFVVQYGGNYINEVCFTVLNDKVELLDFENGDKIIVHFNLKSNEWQGKYFTNATCWKIEKISGSQIKSDNKPIPEAKFEEVDGGDGDDLPF
jgi:hypothetical protein